MSLVTKEELEKLPKFLAAAIGAIYLIGCAVLTLHFSRSGFTDASLLKPRAITVGLVLVLVIAYGIAIGWHIATTKIKHKNYLETIPLRLSLVVPVTNLTMASLSFIERKHAHLAIGYTNGEVSPPVWWVVIGTIMLLVIFGTVIQWIFSKPIAAPIVFAILSVALLTYHFRSLNYTFSRLLIFISMVAFLTALSSLGPELQREERSTPDGVRAVSESNTTSRPALENSDWTSFHSQHVGVFGFTVGVLTFYTYFLFPFMPYEVGGGLAPEVSVFQATGPSSRARLLDEEERGFYLQFDGTQSVTFLPRDQVKRLDFPND